MAPACSNAAIEFAIEAVRLISDFVGTRNRRKYILVYISPSHFPAGNINKFILSGRTLTSTVIFLLSVCRGECYRLMYVHSPRHLTEWAELIDASLPNEYIGCGEDDGNEEDVAYSNDDADESC
jgi:hypothetical protein